MNFRAEILRQVNDKPAPYIEALTVLLPTELQSWCWKDRGEEDRKSLLVFAL